MVGEVQDRGLAVALAERAHECDVDEVVQPGGARVREGAVPAAAALAPVNGDLAGAGNYDEGDQERRGDEVTRRWERRGVLQKPWMPCRVYNKVLNNRAL